MRTMMLKVLLVLAAAFTLPGCVLVSAPSGPIKTEYHRLDKPVAGRTLLILLPGMAMPPEEYTSEGFIPALRNAGLPVDAVTVDAHLGHYLHRTLPDRLLLDVILPARAKGYSKIILLGISMGGVGALLYSQIHPDTVDGLILIAPFLGDAEVIDELESAGGPKAWRPPAELTDKQWQRRLWAWLKRQADPAPSALPPVTLGYGTEDRMARAGDLLAQLLPAQRVFRVPGGHDWPPWKALWEKILKSGALGSSHPETPPFAGAGGAAPSAVLLIGCVPIGMRPLRALHPAPPRSPQLGPKFRDGN
jgi:pimeloyl-ACP methyl ester carboxylesterase